ncbi:DUF115 domain-containing protein [Paenibacillus sp. PK4536]|uniref:motility associated factor glycosyltransferase family protein n=1 Tax=Paenibacillus sp. PK4536 TaxID=3024576 RepID=UPI002359657E|nr:6-hydroxymethylpterin diphosphokinase MptE-like protein [Paenibacillus sp. PK4536]WIM39814.1 DUF115 domain-containing protein [Paenibacillus sp. PK4536]
MIVSNLELNQMVLEQRFNNVAHKTLTIDLNHIKEKETVMEPWDKDEAWLEAVRGSVGDLNIIFVYGFGQGLGIADLLEMYPNRWLFVYEPEEEAFMDSMQNYDFRDLLSHPNLHWLSVGESQLNMLFYLVCSYMQQEMAFVALRHYLDHDMEILHDIKKKFTEYSFTFNSNKRTEEFFRQDWIRNSLYQMPSMLTSPSIEQVRDSFKGVTAVITASGPSLQKDIEWIERLKSHALVIAAGSSIQALVKHDLRPHMTVIMDGNEINNKVFKDPKTLEAPLFHTSSAYYEISARKHDQLIYSVMGNDEFSQYLMGLTKEEISISSTPTVAGTAIQAAIRLGATRIIMMGQDLSFPDNQYYSDGVGHVEAKATAITVQTATQKILNVKGTYNLTDSSFMFMKDSLEEIINAYPTIEFINTTKNGAVIEGTTWMPIEEAFTLIADQHVEPDPIESLIAKSKAEINYSKKEYVQTKISYVINDLKEMKKEIIDIQKLMSKIEEHSRTKPMKAQNTLELIEQKWGKIANREWFEPIFNTVMPTDLREFDQQLPFIVNEKNLPIKCKLINQYLGKLLKDLVEKESFLEQLLNESLIKISEIRPNQFS